MKKIWNSYINIEGSVCFLVVKLSSRRKASLCIANFTVSMIGFVGMRNSVDQTNLPKAERQTTSSEYERRQRHWLSI